MNLAPVIAGLTAAGLSRIEGATALALIAKRPPAHFPAHFVVPDSERGQAKHRVTGIHDQRVDCVFSVVTIVRPDAAADGGSDAQLRRLMAAVEAALAGWRHPDAEGQSTLMLSSQLLSIDDTMIGWAQRFQTQRRIRKEETD